MACARRCCLLLLFLIMTDSASSSVNWPDFRGPTGDGHSTATHLPLAWSETQHIAWKAAIPGRGWSSPVICADQVWLTTATTDGRQLRAVAVDKTDGQIDHEIEVFHVDRPQEIDPLNSYASPSPVIEAGRAYVHFGTYGTACLETTSGRIVWSRRDFPVDHQKGPGSSPILCGDLLVFTRDGNDIQSIVALDKTTGRTVWETNRSVDLSQRAPDFRKSFSTPFSLRYGGETQIVSTAAGGVFAYDVPAGQELWRVRYAGHTNVSRPLAGRGMVFINTGYPKPELWAVRLGGCGDVTSTHVSWKMTRNVPIKPSILLVEDLLYMVTDSGGIVTCLEAESGATVWQQRLGGNYAASPLYAAGNLYLFSEEGRTIVIRPGRTWQKLAENQLNGGFLASPAVSGHSLFVRTRTHLYRIDP